MGNSTIEIKKFIEKWFRFSDHILAQTIDRSVPTNLLNLVKEYDLIILKDDEYYLTEQGKKVKSGKLSLEDLIKESDSILGEDTTNLQKKRAQIYKGDVLVSTTQFIEGKTIKEYIGLITGTSHYEVSFLNLGLVTVGGALSDGILAAMNDIRAKANKIGANAVIGINTNYTYIEKNKQMLLTITGTAVVLE